MMTALTLCKTGSSTLWGGVGVSKGLPPSRPPAVPENEESHVSAEGRRRNWAVRLTEVFGGSGHEGSHGLIQLLVAAGVEGALHEKVCGEVGHGLVHGVSLLPLHQFLFDVTLQHVHSFLKEKTGLTGARRHSGLLGRRRPPVRLGQAKRKGSHGSAFSCPTSPKAPGGQAPSLGLFVLCVLF